ncbi:MAG: transglutaminase-like cysteine peptidase [Beijerinckiaceae bacterium]
MLGGLTRTFLLSIAVLAFGFAPASMHGSAQADDLRTESAPVGAVTTMPYGWADFCGRHADECRVEALQPVDIVLTPKVMRTLRHINAAVNAAIEPVSNLDHWGTMLDHWDYPTDGKGDCKIYALQKRKMLIEMGFPRQALLMTIVRDQEDNGHTILTVKTDKGDFVLDNMVEDIRAWDMTGYQFVKRQSQSDPNVWVSIGTSSAPRTTAAAVTASRSLN